MALKTEKYRKYYLKCSNTFFADCISSFFFLLIHAGFAEYMGHVFEITFVAKYARLPRHSSYCDAGVSPIHHELSQSESFCRHARAHTHLKLYYFSTLTNGILWLVHSATKFIQALAIILAIFLWFDRQFLSSHTYCKQYNA